MTVEAGAAYRHKMATVLQNQLDLDNIHIAEPLPVEDATAQEEYVGQQAEPEQQEVKNPNIFVH